MNDGNKTKTNEALIESLFSVGAHYGSSKSRRHPSTRPFVFGSKNNVQIIDLEATSGQLGKALEFVEALASGGKEIMFVGTKHEAKKPMRDAAEEIGMPFVSHRWTGGSITNYSEIKKRIARLIDLLEQKEKGELAKYTKKERLLIDREIEKLERSFGGFISMKGLPDALFVIDSLHEKIAVDEARKAGIPIISVSNLDCDIDNIDYPISANDASLASVTFFVDKVKEAYKRGQKKNTATAVVE